MTISVEELCEVYQEDARTSSQQQLLWERGSNFLETLLCEASSFTENSLRYEAEAIELV